MRKQLFIVVIGLCAWFALPLWAGEKLSLPKKMEKVPLPKKAEKAQSSKKAKKTRLPGLKRIVAGKRIKDCAVCPEMMGIPAGSLTVKLNDGHGNEKPAHEVHINSFYMSKYEITFEEYDKFCEETGRAKPDDGNWGRKNRPAINVSWKNAVAYTEWLSKKTSKDYRLPTEIEWEYAARAGSQTAWYFGDDVSQLKDYAWYNENSEEQTHPVGQKQPNKFGLYDMIGNVWEWVCSDSDNEGHDSKKENPCSGNDSKNKALRGGSWHSDSNNCRTTSRVANHDFNKPSAKKSGHGGNYGFRVVSIPHIK